MLESLRLEPANVDGTRYVPPALRPLLEAARNGDQLMPAVSATVRRLGFESFMYAIANYHLRPDHQQKTYVFSTLPKDWLARYDERAYIECDPRVLSSFETALPLVWDQQSERGRSRRTDEFLTDALAHRVGSGVAFSIQTGFPARTLVTLDWEGGAIDGERRREIAAHLGDMILFGQYFHELFVKGAMLQGLAPGRSGAGLSARERQCLQLAANGMTSIDIGFKLGITERTANFHFSNIITKLGVLNRHEAIARAISQGLIPPFR